MTKIAAISISSASPVAASSVGIYPCGPIESLYREHLKRNVAANDAYRHTGQDMDVGVLDWIDEPVRQAAPIAAEGEREFAAKTLMAVCDGSGFIDDEICDAIVVEARSRLDLSADADTPRHSEARIPEAKIVSEVERCFLIWRNAHALQDEAFAIAMKLPEEQVKDVEDTELDEAVGNCKDALSNLVRAPADSTNDVAMKLAAITSPGSISSYDVEENLEFLNSEAIRILSA